jgi:hypothetical protein
MQDFDTVSIAAIVTGAIYVIALIVGELTE